MQASAEILDIEMLSAWEDLLCGEDEPKTCEECEKIADEDHEVVIVSDEGGPSAKRPRVDTDKAGPTTWARRLEAVLDLSQVKKVQWRIMTACSGTGSPLLGLQACVLLPFLSLQHDFVSKLIAVERAVWT